MNREPGKRQSEHVADHQGETQSRGARPESQQDLDFSPILSVSPVPAVSVFAEGGRPTAVNRLSSAWRKSSTFVRPQDPSGDDPHPSRLNERAGSGNAGAAANDSSAAPPRHRPSLAHRRVTFPALSSSSRLTADSSDSEFIKLAFHNLANMQNAAPRKGHYGVWPRVGKAPELQAVGTSTSRPDAYQNPDSADPPISLIDILQNDDPLGVGLTMRRVAAVNTSRSSVASSASQPASAFSFPDRSSTYSSKPLMRHSSGIDTSESSKYREPSLNISSTGTSAATTPLIGSVAPDTRRPSIVTPVPSLGRPSESSWTWSDPFDDDKARARRRRSTISGYSVSSNDWNSLRRGSLASITNASPHMQQNPTAYPPSTLPSSQPPISARWEAWVAAYRESVTALSSLALQASHETFFDTTVPARHQPRSMRSSFATDVAQSTSGTLEHGNLFYPLRRQFVAKPGSRSETNRLLIIELCHALEQYSLALTVLWTRYSDFLRISGSPGGSDQRAQTLSDLEGVSMSRTTKPQSTFSDEPFDSVQESMTHLELVANEVDSLVREIIEAVPTFSYALGQGNYGPLPFSLHQSSKTPKGSTLRAYLEQVKAIPSIVGSTDLQQSSSGSQYDAFLEAEDISPEAWWPARLKADLTDGLLAEIAEESPSANLTTSASVDAHSISNRSLTGLVRDNDRRSVLLEEGRKRWLQYQHARQQP